MPDTAISALTAAAALTGTEVLPIVQATSTVRTTAQEIANLASVTSAMAETLSNAVSALEVRVSTLSAAPPGSGSVTSTELSAAVGVSVLATGLVSIKGLQSVVNTLSDRVSGAYDLAAAADLHASTASAAATSVDARVNTVSNLVSQHAVSLAQLSNAVSAVEVHASAASAAATSVDTRVNALSQTLSAVSALSVGVAANGLQSAINALSNTISAVSAAVTSVDTRLNTASNLVSQHTVSLAQLSNAVSLLNNVSTASAATSVKGLQSVIVQISNRLSAISAAATSVDGRVNTVSNLVSQHTVSLAQLSNATSLLNTVSAASAATSVKGLQSVINQLSNRISAVVLGGGGMTSDQASAMIASVLTTKYSARTSIGGATSTKGLQSALDDLSLQISSLNSVVSNALSAGDVISLKIVSMASTLSHLASIVSLVSCTSAAGTAVGLQSVVNALSAGLASAEVHASAASAAATSVNGRVTSVNNLWTSGLGTTVGIGINTNGVVMTGNSFTNVSGLAVALAASGDYQIDGRVFFTLSILTGTRFGFSYNGSGNGQMVKGAMDMHCTTSVIAAAISNLVSTNFSYGHINEAAMSNVATVNISIAGGASATTHMLLIEGMLQNGASAVTLNLQAAHSAASGGINILAGSYIRAYRIV